MRRRHVPFYADYADWADWTDWTDWTDNLERRTNAHNMDKGSRYTRSRLPLTLVYSEEFASKNEAVRREREIENEKSRK
ncbi:MAG: GIY-YIG nuclease family protein [Synergistaceae bacterium]|nr:GIY-YIG nuclease family protein [Synergistaceae bacterium]